MIEETWCLRWFPPDVEMRTRTFKTRKGVDDFLEKQAEDYEVTYPAGEWNPTLTHITKTVREEMVELIPQSDDVRSE